jgi:hypothetical protein
MNETAELIKAIALLCWPICILAIAYIFRAEIKKLLIKDRQINSPAQPTENENKISTRKNIEEKVVSSTIAQISKAPNSEPFLPILPEDKNIKPLIIKSYISVCKNNKSGNYFVVLDELDDNKVKLITPECKIKDLNPSLFTAPEELDENEMLESRRLTKCQVDLYYEKLNKNEEAFTSPSIGLYKQQTTGIQPRYITTYRNMRSNPETMPSIMLMTVRKHRRISWVELIEILKNNYGYKGTGGSLNASMRVLNIDGLVREEGKGDSRIISVL